jgi:hypothetical protein
MAYVTSDLTAVEKAISDLVKGERIASVTMKTGETIQYTQAQLKDLQAIRSAILQELDPPTTSTKRFVLIQTSKGLD